MTRGEAFGISWDFIEIAKNRDIEKYMEFAEKLKSKSGLPLEVKFENELPYIDFNIENRKGFFMDTWDVEAQMYISITTLLYCINDPVFHE